jgi:hypothetical protein
MNEDEDKNSPPPKETPEEARRHWERPSLPVPPLTGAMNPKSTEPERRVFSPRAGYAKGGPVIRAAAKGSGPVSAKFAQGGPVLTSRSRFLKTPDSVRTGIQRNDFGGKKDPLAKPEGDAKSLPPIKPRK